MFRLFFHKIVEIERFALRAAILDEFQNYLGGGGRFGWENRALWTVWKNSWLQREIRDEVGILFWLGTFLKFRLRKRLKASVN